jgi:hypothetical protein
MYTLVIRSDLNTNIARGIPVGCSMPMVAAVPRLAQHLHQLCMTPQNPTDTQTDESPHQIETMEEELFEFHNIFLNRLEGSTIQERSTEQVILMHEHLIF